jgi:hypothetical protein
MTKDPCMTKDQIDRRVEDQRKEMDRKLAVLEAVYPDSGMVQTWKLAHAEFRLTYPMIAQIRNMHEEIC